MVKGSVEWKAEMMVHRSGRKINKAFFFRAASGALDAVCIMLVCACMGSFTLSVQAAPATLVSLDATIYEQADEGSSPVGNLVEGSTFEYIGDVTAADGSVWHQITTTGGVNGYIRGDREIEAGTEEPAPEGQGEPEAAPEDNPDGSNPDGNDPDGNDPDRSSPEENNPLQAADMQNNQQKKYVLDPSEKIKVKDRESFMALDTDVLSEKSTRAGIDKTLYVSMAVVLFCVVMVHICLKRMRTLKHGAKSGEILNAGRGKTHKKQKRKNTAPKGKKGAKRS